MDSSVDLFLARARESLDGTAAELEQGRRHNSANRAYYACFQAAVAALLLFRLYSSRPAAELSHKAVQALFAGELVQRRKRFPAEFRRTLPDLMAIRHAADYWASGVSEREAARAAARARAFVEAILAVVVEQRL